MTVALAQQLVQSYLNRHPLEAARAMESLEVAELAEALSSPDTDAAPALRYVTPDVLAAVLEHMQTADAGRVLAMMSIDTQLSVLPLVDAGIRENVLRTLDDKDARLLERLLTYPAQTAASLVESDTFRIPPDITAGEAIERSRAAASPVRYYVYVVDRDHRLAGVVSLKQLMRAASDVPVSGIMRRRPACIAATDTAAEVAGHDHWRRFPMLPVVDTDDRLVGVILYETLQKLREEGVYEGGWTDTRETLIALSEIYWLGLSTALGSPPEGHDER